MATIEALIAAVKEGDLERVEALLGEDPALLDARDAAGNSAVLIATYWGKRDIQQALLARGPALTVFEAAATGQLARVAELVDADPALARGFSPDGFSALHLAAFFGHAPTAFYLLDKSDVNAVAVNGSLLQPLHSAVAGNHLDIVMALLSNGAEVNSRQGEGFTPLMGAAQNGNATMVRLLLGLGADPAALSDGGKTARDYAAASGSAAALAALPMTRADFMKAVAAGRAAWEDLIARVPAQRAEEGGVEGYWSVKDIVAHVAAWERWTAAQIAAHVRAQPATTVEKWGTPIPAELGDEDSVAVNDYVAERMRDLGLDEVLAASRRIHAGFVAAVGAVTDRELLDPMAPFPEIRYKRDAPLWQTLADQTYQHAEEHAAPIRAWLERIAAGRAEEPA